MNKYKLFIFLSLIITPIILYGNIYFKHLEKYEGITKSTVLSICQDELGRIWFGTLNGLICYDGREMKVFNSSDFHNINNECYDLVCDNRGNILFISGRKLISYNYYKEEFYNISDGASFIYKKGNKILPVLKDSVFKWNSIEKEISFEYILETQAKSQKCLSIDDRFRWIGTDQGLFCYNKTKKKYNCVIPNVIVSTLFMDFNNRLWVATYRDGVYCIECNNYDITINKVKIDDNEARCIIEDSHNNIFIGTSKGLYRIDDSGVINKYVHDKLPGNLTNSSIFSFYKDSQGTIWVGTYYGDINYFNSNIDIFNNYTYDLHNDNGEYLSFGYVADMVEDKSGNIWIITEGGGLNYLDRKTNKISHFFNKESLKNSYFPMMKCVVYDKNNDCLYIGTHKQGFICFDITTQKLKYNNLKIGESIKTLSLRGDSLYILSSKGFFVYNTKNNEYYHPYKDIPQTYKYGSTFYIDGNILWLAFFDRILKIDMNSLQLIDEYKYGEKGLGNSYINWIVKVEDNTFLGTMGDGIYKYNANNNSFIRCFEDIDYCYFMKSNKKDHIAITCEKGLVLCNYKKGILRTVDENKRLHISSFNDNCGVLFCKNGEVFVGGTSGMSSFFLEKLYDSYPEYKLYLSSLEINNTLVSVNSNQEILNKSISFTDKIRLKHSQNNIKLTFTSNDFVGGISFENMEYCLYGFDDVWHNCYDNSLVFTNLPPGNYNLVIREKDKKTDLDSHSLSFSFVISKPWWNNGYAYTVYVIVIFLLVYFIYKDWKTKMDLRLSLVTERMEKQKHEEILQSKLQFFANISHEFRTPLTFILSETEQLLSVSTISPYMRVRLKRILKSAYGFRELISELLDYRKMENGKFKLNIARFNLLTFLNDITEDFKYHSKKNKNIEISFTTVETDVYCWGDMRQLRKVFTNLLSNAIKYTGVNGKIEIILAVSSTGIEIKVIDNGDGISENDLPYIFERFYQVDSDKSSMGSGIGLALVKEIVELHNGTISVSSALDYGSIFTVTLPLDNIFENSENISFISSDEVVDLENDKVCNIDEEDTDSSQYWIDDENDVSSSENKYKILVVEDNEDIILLLKELLSQIYNVSIAKNGEEGLYKIKEEKPDLILSDVMMPVMSGIDMCKKIKDSSEFCHIPVILLTALSDDDNMMNGIMAGADDYIEKPFNNKILLSKIANILRNRRLLIDSYGKNSANKNSDNVKPLVINSSDAKLLENLDRVIDKHIEDTNFNVELLAKELSMSRSSLYSKLKVLINMSPNEYIIDYRLKYAKNLLLTNYKLQITEIAELSGFCTTQHFRHCFKLKYGESPLESRKK